MAAIIQPTHNQSPIQVEGETNEYQSKPDVVVTGFGPFRLTLINPSFQIAQALPSFLESGDGSNIHITYHPEAIHVTWESVIQVIPELYNRHASPSGDSGTTQGDISSIPFFIHIGVAREEGCYYIETVALRDGYWRTDVDGKHAPQRKNCDVRGYPCNGDEDPLCPGEIKTAIDVDGVLEDVRSEVGDLTLRIERSVDAGDWMCGFIFYTSLREARLRYGNAGLSKVLFVHVPPDGKLDEGVRVLSAVIRSIVKRGKDQSGSA